MKTIARRILDKALEHLARAIETRDGLGKLMLMSALPPASDELEITTDHAAERTTMHLSGSLNIESSPAFRDRLLPILQAQSPEAVIVDFSNVLYVDSYGIATLVEGLKMAQQRQATLCLRGLPCGLFRLFEVTGMTTLYEKSGCMSVSSE